MREYRGMSDEAAALPAPAVHRDGIRAIGDDLVGFGFGDAPNRAELHTLLESQVHYECVKVLRRRVVHLVAIFGALLWILAAWPQRVPVELRRFVLIAWCFPFAGAVALGFVERKFRGHRDRCFKVSP